MSTRSATATAIQIGRGASCANRRSTPRWLLLHARQSSVMLHVRRVVTSSFLAETSPFAVRLRYNTSAPTDGASKRTVGDRAINRGLVTREMMRENYLRILDKCKCEYPSIQRGHADVASSSYTSVSLPQTGLATRARRALSIASMSRLRGFDHGACAARSIRSISRSGDLDTRGARAAPTPDTSLRLGGDAPLRVSLSHLLSPPPLSSFSRSLFVSPGKAGVKFN